MEAAGKAVLINVQVAPDLLVFVDRHLVVSALSNLVQNAIKFTRTDGRVEIRAKRSLDRILIEVEDECGGLPSGKSEELFKPFIQKSSDKSGIGLGLSISNRAIALNDGQISASNIPGKGCVFIIDLPLLLPLLDERKATIALAH